ncbi:MAG: hypothetical protein JSW67_04210 [Candidatus Latescibacterota bacterium]|nr:MAG: hypothetical protein JSW67_04210 [Candidatus Latescibacterota bacterium]
MRNTQHTRRGFTVFELLVSTLVAGVALLATMLIASQMSTQMRSERNRVNAQDNARIAIDEITRILRAAGSQTDNARGQGRFVFGGPWTVALNANLFPIDDPDGTGDPAALDLALGGADVPLGGGVTYTPPRSFQTGAETIVLTIDSSRDGYVSSGDASDDEEEESDNPDDFVVKAFVYGSDGTGNTVQEAGLALLRGPYPGADGNYTEPMFKYWINDDNDDSTPALLHGDLDGNGELSQGEIAMLGPVAPTDLALISRIDVTATAESEKAGNYYSGTHRDGRSVLRSSVSFRNHMTTAVRVVGTVFNDANKNSLRDPGEVPLRDVVVRLSNGSATKTDALGFFKFVTRPGTYTLQEIDKVGFASTTPNIVSLNPAPGDYVEVHFGDYSTVGSGFIHGKVWHDNNKNGVLEKNEEWGIPGINVFLDTGATALTDSAGNFLFTVSTGNYTVTEVDSAGYTSSTPNVVDVNVAADGDSAYVLFGDYELKTFGEIHGLVYFDENKDGVHDNLEPGIANVTVTLDGGDVTVTDAMGEFQFTASPGTHEVTETDPEEYTSSTVNTVTVEVYENKISYVEFGDIGIQDVAFQEIHLADTERALSIVATDLGEDARTDFDVVLGTHYVGGSNDILVWHNQRRNSSTLNSKIFEQTPSYQRIIDADVNAVTAVDLNKDGMSDVVTGLGASSNNIGVWITDVNSPGDMPYAPNARYTAALATGVNDMVVGDFDGDPYPDLAVGTTAGYGLGRLEVWHGGWGSAFGREDGDVYALIPFLGGASGEAFGEVVSVASSDFNRDGVDDLVVGTRKSDSMSYVSLLLWTPLDQAASPDTSQTPVLSSTSYYLHARFQVFGALQQVLALDMKEDDQGDVDIVVASALASTSGMVQVWHNRGDNHFGFGETRDAAPSDQVDPQGAPLSIVAAKADNDVFPDILVGTRTSEAYDGQVLLYRAFGFLPSSGEPISQSSAGEVVTMTIGDFNKDGAPDVATGTRTSASTGKVVVFFNESSGL